MSTYSLKALALPFFARLCEAPAEEGNPELSLQAQSLDALLRDFEHQALLRVGDTDLVGKACYLLAIAADEWFVDRLGIAWMRHSLLVRHHGDAHGGERCWQALEMLLHREPSSLRPSEKDLLALYELAIGFGFRGRYRSLPDGEQRIHELRLQLYERLHATHVHELQTRQLIEWATRHLDRRQRWRGVAIAGLCLFALVLAVVLTQWKVNQQWAELSTVLSQIVDAPVLRPTGKQP